jgi:hypothetical protein
MNRVATERRKTMISLSSKIQNQTYPLNELEHLLKPLGYDIGGGWEYDYGFFDYKIDDEAGYTFLRVPFKAVKGQLDQNGAVVEIGEPYLLNHKYQRGLDDNAQVGNASASLNQFSEPVDADASIDERWIKIGEQLVQELENVLLS